MKNYIYQDFPGENQLCDCSYSPVTSRITVERALRKHFNLKTRHTYISMIKHGLLHAEMYSRRDVLEYS